MKRIVFVLVLSFLLLPCFVYAQSPHVSSAGFGGHFAWWEPKDADEASLFYGIQTRLRISDTFAIEGSLDYYSENIGSNVEMTIYPLQASLLIYLIPSRVLEVYILGGAGWYNYEIDTLNKDESGQEFGWHGGAGLELPLTEYFSVHGDLRWVYFKPEIEASDYDDWSGLWTNIGITFYF